MREFDMRSAWEQASASYLANRGSAADEITYGALSPGESELRLLGSLGGIRVLDAGCGGGHNALVCARAGAQVTAVDISPAQLTAAQARVAGLAVDWVLGDLSSDALAVDGEFDRVLAVHVLGYVADLGATLRRLRSLLACEGRLVASIDHPVRTCFYDLEGDELTGIPLRSYFDRQPLVWRFEDGSPMRQRHLPMSGWLDAFAAAGLYLERLCEPSVPADVAEELWPEDSPLATLAALPHTAIFVLRAVV